MLRHDEPRQHPAKWEKPVQTTPLTRFSVYKMFQIDQYRQGKQVSRCQRPGLEWGVRAGGDGVSFWGEKNVLKLTVTMAAQL